MDIALPARELLISGSPSPAQQKMTRTVVNSSSQRILSMLLGKRRSGTTTRMDILCQNRSAGVAQVIIFPW